MFLCVRERVCADSRSQDGFFPQEFKEQYPDGVLITAHDRRYESFGDNFEAFSGEGRALGQRVRTLSQLGSPNFSLGADELLRKLPEKVGSWGDVPSLSVAIGVAGRALVCVLCSSLTVISVQTCR